MAADKKPVAGKAKQPAGKNSRTAPPTSPAVALEPKRAPERPSGRRKSKEHKARSRLVQNLSSMLTAMMLFVTAAAATGVLLNAQFEGPGPLTTAKGFVVPKGEGRLDIAARLERDGIIANRWTFAAGQLIQIGLGLRKSAELKAGSYEFKRGISMREVVDVLVEGKSVAARITIPEGLTSQQIVERLKASDVLAGDITTIPAEGSLLPDTYVFTRGTGRQELIERMAAEQTKFVAAAWEKRASNLPFQTLPQAIIMASIIEKETGRSDEREKVAAVFVNRLRKNMRLQSDPTIIYGIVGGQGPLGRPIMRSDIDQKTVYNTYQIDGLPPTPISNPGRAAIEATLNPAQTNDIYFVADGTGGHAFTENLKDHNAAVANWRRIEKEARAAKAAQAQAAAVAAAQPLQATKINGTGPAPVAAAASRPDALPLLPQEPAADEAADSAAATAPPASPAPVLAIATSIPLPVRKPKK